MDDFRVGSVPTPPDPYRQPSRSISRKQDKEHSEEGEGGREPEEEASDSFQTHEDPPADEPVADYYVPSDPTDAE